MRGHGHDRAGAVSHEDVVCDPHRDLLAINRIRGIGAGENACLFLGEVGALEIGLRTDFFLILLHDSALVRRCDLRHERMLGGEHHIRRPEERVRARGEYGHFALGTRHFKFHQGPLAAADPVFLEELDRVRPVEPVKSVDQPLGECGDPQHPLAERAAFDGEAADFAFSIHDLLIGENCAEFGAPIHRHLGHIGEAHAVGIAAGIAFNRLGSVCQRIEPRIVEFEKYPLGPAEISGIGGAELAGPVIAEPKRLKLAAESPDIPRRGHTGMLPCFYGELLGWQSKGVPTHRVQDIVAQHAVMARQDVRRRVALDVPDMKPVAARVGEHIQDVIFRSGGIEAWVAGVGGMERSGGDPVLLPSWFEFGERKLLALRGHCRNR